MDRYDVNQCGEGAGNIYKDDEGEVIYYSDHLESMKELLTALNEIEKSDRVRQWATCPDCDFPNNCSRENGCESMRYSKVGEIASKAIKESTQ